MRTCPQLHALSLLLALALALPMAHAQAQSRANAPTPATVADPALARQLGADARGMRNYMLVILKTGPRRVPAGPARDAMFKGHFANMERLANAGKLVIAGPFTDKTDWRGMFVFAVASKEEAEALVATDPVIREGEMIAEYHALYASAALMQANAIHRRIAPE